MTKNWLNLRLRTMNLPHKFKLFTRVALSLSVTAGLLGAPPISQASEMVDRILVVVNDEIITIRDLYASMEPVVAQYRATLSGTDFEEKVAETERLFMTKLINERLIRSAAKRSTK